MAQLIPLTSFSKPPRDSGWSITRRELIASPPERVWRALTDPAELARWWCDFAEVEPQAGGRYAFGGAAVYGDSPATIEELRESPGREVLDVDAPSRLEVRWPLHGVETGVVFELANHLETTELTVTQSADRAPGWDPGPGPSWWWVALPALRSHVENGRPGLRLDYTKASGPGEVFLEVGVTTFPWIIWHKLTHPPELNRWWARQALLELRPQGPFRLGLEGHGPRVVLEIDEGRRLLHDWLWPDGSESTVEWSIRETDDDVLLSVRDRASSSTSAPPVSRWIHWASTLLGLKQMSERGESPSEYQAQQP